MNILFVGDLHGDVELMKKIAEYADMHNRKIVQVGDLVDSFEFNASDQIELLNFCIQRKEEHGDIFLMGNHDMSYLYSYHICSGYNMKYAYIYRELIHQLNPDFYYVVDDILVTHAGLSQRFVDVEMKDMQIDDLKSLCDVIDEQTNNIKSPILEAGRSRGGNQPFGGITWCDYYRDFEPLKRLSIKQVFGHTIVKDIECYTKPSGEITHNFNIDCLQFKPNVLEYRTETKIFKNVEIL